MSDINLFLRSFINGFNTGYKAGGVGNNLFQNPEGIGEGNLSSNTADILPKTTEQLNKTTAELSSLNPQDTINMLKELLKFPKDLDNFLAKLADKSQNMKMNTALLLLTSSLDVSALSKMLQANSKEALANLYQMLAQFNQLGVKLKDSQTGEISKLISFVSSSSTSDVQSVKTLLLMYLPWLPLTDPNAFKLEIEKKANDDAQGADDSVTILISTENYGNLQADVYKTDKDGILINLITSQTFPQQELSLLMKEESKKYNININLNMAVKEAFNKKEKEKFEQQVSMNTSPGVNLFLLLISSSLIKNVHIVDTKQNLREKRKEMLDNGKS